MSTIFSLLSFIIIDWTGVGSDSAVETVISARIKVFTWRPNSE
jgi:hypothetical protein